MAEMRVSAERRINAPADDVYHYIANFQDHHHRFLPPAFSDFRVEEGGVGAGTIATFSITAAGRTQKYRSLVAEPVPGRVLTETDLLGGAVTTFTVTPEGDATRVRFETVWQKAGIAGVFERLVAPAIVRRLYADELERLDRYAREQTRNGELSNPRP